MIGIPSTSKPLILGTALWGWGIARNEAYALLENYVENGGALVDTATNYPINKCKADIGLAIKWLADWKAAHPNAQFSLIVKIGSKNNLGGPEVDLTPGNIIDTTNRMRDVFADALSCVSIHWDNRGDSPSDHNAINETVEAMAKIHQASLDIGLSGIKHPELYLQSNLALADSWLIQVKENFLTKSARLSYEKYFASARYYAYGLNMGGVTTEALKSDSSINLRAIKTEASLIERIKSFVELDHGIKPHPATLNELSLAFAYFNPSLAGVIIGPRNVTQLLTTLDYWCQLNQSEISSKDFSRLAELFKTS